MEVWKNVPDTDGKYQVSDMGNVRSCVKRDDWYPLKPYQDTCGYLYVEIHKRSRGVHRLVADAFLPEDSGKREINHKNGNKHDNRLSNLERCTRSENVKHAYDSGLKTSAKRGDCVRARCVVCLDTGEKYSCMIDAEAATGARAANISKCCRGIRNKAGGFRWAYAKGGDANVV